MNPYVGEKIQVTKRIEDDGQDHHPACVMAEIGDIVEVIDVFDSGTLHVRHEGFKGAFTLYPNEYKTI
jgi:hypothetical protein